jgi:hypothetical protein
VPFSGEANYSKGLPLLARTFKWMVRAVQIADCAQYARRAVRDYQTSVPLPHPFQQIMPTTIITYYEFLIHMQLIDCPLI